MNRVRANLSWMIVVCAMGSFGATVPAGADLATMKDYYYYASGEYEGNDRANHTITAGGEYTLSADRIWSSLIVNPNITSPVLLNLSGHALTVTGCDAVGRPLWCKNNTTAIISNGTFKTVFDMQAYPWTSSNPEAWYMGYQGAKAGVDNLTNAKLIIANGGTLDVNNGASNTVTFAGNDNCVIVEAGGKLNSMPAVRL